MQSSRELQLGFKRASLSFRHDKNGQLQLAWARNASFCFVCSICFLCCYAISYGHAHIIDCCYAHACSNHQSARDYTFFTANSEKKCDRELIGQQQ